MRRKCGARFPIDNKNLGRAFLRIGVLLRGRQGFSKRQKPAPPLPRIALFNDSRYSGAGVGPSPSPHYGGPASRKETRAHVLAARHTHAVAGEKYSGVGRSLYVLYPSTYILPQGVLGFLGLPALVAETCQI